MRLTGLATKYNLINKSFKVTPETIRPYLATLSASILTQTSLHDAMRLKKPIILLYGNLDPWVKKRNLKALAAANPRAELRTLVAGHEVRGPYVKAVVSAVRDSVTRI